MRCFLIDAQIIFNRLDRSVIRDIVVIRLHGCAKMLASRGLELELDSEARDFLAEVGYDPAFGARPLKRALREYILEPLSEKLISGEIPPGAVVQVRKEVGEDRLRLTPLSNQAAVTP